MESTQKTINHSNQDEVHSFEHFAESTNPFPNRDSSTEPRPVQSSSHGKRPRIYKPVYSARLS